MEQRYTTKQGKTSNTQEKSIEMGTKRKIKMKTTGEC